MTSMRFRVRAAVLDSAERHHGVDGAVSVDPHGSYSKRFANPKGSLDIASPYMGSQSVA
jgi:hypothetical protein